MDWEVRAASLILFLGILLATIENGIAERKIVCYYTNWSIYRPGTAKFSPQNINPYLCTHLIYAFGGFTKDNTLKPFDKYQDIEKGGYAKFTGLKTYNKNLKTMLAIGGWNEGSSRFSPMVADATRRREFVKNAIKFLRQNHFDGLDLDWEYPAFRDGGKPRDKDNYANLVQELREEFERESSKTGRPRLLLSMAMPAGVEYIDKGYDVPRLDEYLDFINLLSYDYHSAYEPAVNHHSPLYPLEEDNEYNYDAELTIDYTINHLLEKGASTDKIVLGIPTYGRSYTLFNQDATDLGSPADGPGVEGEATREKGYLAYYEICENIAGSDEWEVIQPNPEAMGPYAFKADQWVGYDDEDIVRLKARYVNEKKLGGIMFWSIDNDDFRGKCHGRPYPLIEAAKEAMLTENRNTIDKTKSVDDRKKTRIQSNSVARKSSNRRSTTAAPITRKRISSSRPKYRTITRSKASDEEQEDREVSRRSYDPSSEEDIEGRNTVRVTEKTTRPKIRSKTRSGSSDRSSRRKQSRRKGQAKSSEQESLSNKLTTPEPPTTPDPGTDFKCEDEGFFSHPRDCKKYFWCLDSGPGGLGVIAHQFTCPSGLVFNKAADSCDYPRNVICPKSKTSVVSTTKSPITAATSRTTYLHSTTTAKTEEEEEYDSDEDYDEDEIEESEEEEVKEAPKITTTAKPLVYKTLTRNRLSTTTSKPSEPERNFAFEDEEDPRVIKELIDLIKKAGGIEQLEKQLLLQEKNSGITSGSENVTPATISRSLYERVLNRQANKIGNQRSVLSSSETSYVNGPGRAQFEGLDDIPEVKNLRRSQKPQYVTIERPKSATKNEDENDEDEEDDNTDTIFSDEQNVSNPLGSLSTQRVTPNYVNIRRTRPSIITSRNENDVGEKETKVKEERSIRRWRPGLSSKQQDNESSLETSKPARNRSPIFRNSDKGDDSESANRSAEKDDGLSTMKSRYVNIQRFRSTTSKISENLPDIVTSSEPTSETTPSSKPEEYPEISSTTTSTTTSTSTTPTPTTSTSTEVITVISVEPPEIPSEIPLEIPSRVSVTVGSTSSTTEPVKLVEDSATEILLTTVSAKSQTQSTTTTASSRSTIAAVSQPRPFGFTRRRSSSFETTTTATLTTPSSNPRSKVADSEAIRLPTLKELIGYPTVYDRTTTLPSVLLHLLRFDVDNDISQQNVEELAGDTNESDLSAGVVPNDEKEFAQLPRKAEEFGDSWLQQISESKAKSPKRDIAIGERTSITNVIQDENKRKKSLTYLKPTTMRGVSLASLTPSPVTRGFYVTKSQNDLSSSDKMDDLITYSALEQQTETTLIPNISTTDEIVTVTHIEPDQNTAIDDTNDIINNKDSDFHEEKFSTVGSLSISSENSDSTENFSDYEEFDIIANPVSKPASKRGKSLRKFDRNTTPLSNVISPTTPTRRAIDLAVSRYNELTTPIWTGRRIIGRKRNRVTVSSIKNAIRRTESEINHGRGSSAISTISSIPTSAIRKFSTVPTISTTPPIVSEPTIFSETTNVHSNIANLNDVKTKDFKNLATTEAAVTLTNSVTEGTNNPTTMTVPIITDVPIVTSIPSISAVAPEVAVDSVIKTTVATTNAEFETISAITDHTVATISATENTHAIESNSTIATILASNEIKTIPTTEKYSEVAITANDSVTMTTTAAENTEGKTIFTIDDYSTEPIIRDEDMYTTATDFKVTTTASTKVKITPTENYSDIVSATNDFVIMTTSEPASTESNGAFMINNYSLIPIIRNANTHTIATDSIITATSTPMNTEVVTEVPKITNYSEIAMIHTEIANDTVITTTPVSANTEGETTFTVEDYFTAPILGNANAHITSADSVVTSSIANIKIETTPTGYSEVEATVNMGTIMNDTIITTTPVSANTESETAFTIEDSIVPIIRNTNTIAADSVTTNTNIEITSTVTNYSIASIPTTYDITTDSMINTEITSKDYPIDTASDISSAHTTAIPVTNNLQLTTSISSSTDMSETVSARTNTPTDADAITTNMITTIMPTTVTTTDANIITTFVHPNISSTVAFAIPNISTTATDFETTSAPSYEDLVMSTDIISTSSAASRALTTKSSTILPAVPNIPDINNNSRIPAVTEIAESIQTTNIPTTFETSPIYNSTTADPKFLLSSDLATTASSIKIDETSATSATIEIPPTLLSILNPNIKTVTVALEKSTVFPTILTPATSSEKVSPVTESIAAKSILRSTYNKPDIIQTTSEKSTTPELIINSKETTSKTTRTRTRDRTISKFDTISYQFGEKTSGRTVHQINDQPINLDEKSTTRQPTRQYPRRRITVYRGQPRKSQDSYSSSRVALDNRKRRIVQKRLRTNAERSSTLKPDENIQNSTEEYVTHSRAKNVGRRSRIVLKRVRERMEKEETTNVPSTLPEETTILTQVPNSIKDEALRIHHEDGRIGKRRKLVLKRVKSPSKEASTTKEIDSDIKSLDERHLNSLKNESEELSKEEKAKKRTRVVLKSIRPKFEGKNSTIEETMKSDSIDENLSSNFSVTSPDDIIMKKKDKGTSRRRTRIVIKNIRPKSEEKNSTMEEVADSNLINESLRSDFSSNFHMENNNFKNKNKTRRVMKIVLKEVRSKSEDKNSTAEEARVNFDTNENIHRNTSSNLRIGKNLHNEESTRRRIRVLKRVKPKSAEGKSVIEKANVNSDSTDEDLQGDFSSKLYVSEDPNKEEIERRMKTVLKEIRQKLEEEQTTTEKAGPVSIDESYQDNPRASSNVSDKKKTMKSRPKEEMTTKQPEQSDAELRTTKMSVRVQEDTDRPSNEANLSKNGSVTRKSSTGHSNRQRKKPNPTANPLSSTVPSASTTHRRGKPVDATLSPRIDLVDALEGTESYVRLTGLEVDQRADVSDQSIRAQEYAVTLADPPSSSYQPSSSSSDTGYSPLRDAVRRKISTTVTPRTDPTSTSRTISRYGSDFRSRQRSKTKDRPTVNATTRPRRPPVIDYDYYEDEVPIVVDKSALNSKLFLTSKGTIRCLDQGNFPHPYSCKKFITCARMVNGQVIGTEYSCPEKLSFDPVGGICNWSAGLGCKD